MAKLLRTLMSLAFVLGVTAVVVPGTATAAYPTAHLTKTQYLRHDPNGGLADSCVHRDIDLKKGHYDWGLRMGGDRQVRRANLFLETGKYSWETCLNPEYGDYIHTSVLVPHNPAWSPVSISRRWELPSSKTYTWGSYLDPRF